MCEPDTKCTWWARGDFFGSFSSFDFFLWEKVGQLTDYFKQPLFLNLSLEFSYVEKCKFFKWKKETTFDNGSLGSRNDEERSEMRYVMWIAEFSESSNLWTHIALSGIPESMPVWVPINSQSLSYFAIRLILDLSWPCKNLQQLLKLNFQWVWLTSENLENEIEWGLFYLSLFRVLFSLSLNAMLFYGVALYFVGNYTKTSNFKTLVSNQVGGPAELKHINKRRKRN